MNTIVNILLGIAKFFARNIKVPVAVAERAVKEADTDNDGMLSIEELIQVVRTIVRAFK